MLEFLETSPDVFLALKDETERIRAALGAGQFEQLYWDGSLRLNGRWLVPVEDYGITLIFYLGDVKIFDYLGPDDLADWTTAALITPLG